MASGYGSIVLWGYSPAIDLRALHTIISSCAHKATADKDGDKAQGGTQPQPQPQRSFKALTAGASDARHVITTLARVNRGGDDEDKGACGGHTIHFDVVEQSYESIARQLLFLSILHEPNDETSLQGLRGWGCGCRCTAKCAPSFDAPCVSSLSFCLSVSVSLRL